MNVMLKSIIIAMANHSCEHHRSIDMDNDISLPDLLNKVSSSVETIRRRCSQCFLIGNNLSCADAAQLIVLNEQNHWTLCVDLHVYGSNQQFRLYDCVKYQSNNPLNLSLTYPFDQSQPYTKLDILRKSIVTLVEQDQIPMMNFEERDPIGLLQKMMHSYTRSILSNTSSNVRQKKEKCDLSFCIVL